LRISLRDTLEIELHEGATGYRWALAEDLSRGIGEVVQVGVAFKAPASDAPGAAGARTFRVSAKRVGKAHVVLVLKQPWDPSAEPADRFEVILEVAQHG
jgi:predicted secreted protein